MYSQKIYINKKIEKIIISKKQNINFYNLSYKTRINIINERIKLYKIIKLII